MTPTAFLSRAAVQFESLLGDPLDSAHVMSWASAMRRDEAEAYPADALELLHSHGISQFHIPAGYGGCLESFEQLFALSRALGRRDPSVSLTAGMQIWSQLIWIGGSPVQQALMRDVLLANLYPCLAVSEEMHGADVVAGAVTAHESGAAIRLNGTKWLVGLAQRSVLALVLARTAGMTGYRGLSWYLVEKARLAAGSCKPLPRVRTMGMRAAEISGLNFDDAELPPDARIGEAGDGLPLMLRLFQITRTLVCGIALGAAETALRIATAFTLWRRLYGTTAAAIPYVRDQLTGAYVDLLAAEALMISSVRGIHQRPEELSVTSLITKIVVPELTGRVLRVCADVLGARYYLREGFAEGVFQKMLRDHAVIQLFDGSSGVCLAALTAQLSTLAKGLGRDHRNECQNRIAERFVLNSAVRPFNPAALELTARGSDDVLQSGSKHPGLRFAVDTFLTSLQDLTLRSPAAFAAAHNYCLLHAAAACIHAAAYIPSGPENWEQAALRRLLEPSQPLTGYLGDATVQMIFDRLVADVSAPHALSLLALALPDSPISLEKEQ